MYTGDCFDNLKENLINCFH